MALLAGGAQAASGGKAGVVRDLATRVGPVVGAATACRSIARPRIKAVMDKFSTLVNDATTETEFAEISQSLDRSIADGSRSVATGQLDCGTADRQLSDLERSIGAGAPSLTAPAAPTAAAPSLAAPAAAGAAGPAVRGITDREIRFGMVGPFSGPQKDVGRQTKMGIEAAFNRANEAGGVEGRTLRLISADDGYEAGRTVDAMKQLYDKDQVFGFVGFVGTANAVVALPYALERRVLFFGGRSGGPALRHDPPDRYVFNYRVSLAEETDAAVRYLVKVRRIPPKQIVVFAQQDDFGDSGFAGVSKAMRGLGVADSAILRLNYKRNSIDVEDPINQLKALKTPIKAVIMVATTRAAAKFIEKTRDLIPGLIYSNVSSVGGSALAEELQLLGPRYGAGIIVTQVVPAVSGYSSLILEYKAALAKSFQGEAPDYVSLEAYITATILVQALKRVGPSLDNEKLVDALEATRNLDIGLGTPINFGRAEHQAVHKVWGTVLDEGGKYQSLDLE
jgi:ABC-type branched-subunit amino acid transport system substrate-binding protein